MLHRFSVCVRAFMRYLRRCSFIEGRQTHLLKMEFINKIAEAVKEGEVPSEQQRVEAPRHERLPDIAIVIPRDLPEPEMRRQSSIINPDLCGCFLVYDENLVSPSRRGGLASA